MPRAFPNLPQVQININRPAAAAVGLSSADLAEAAEIAFNGEVVSQVLEDQPTYDVLVRLTDRAGVPMPWGLFTGSETVELRANFGGSSGSPGNSPRQPDPIHSRA